MSRLGSVFALLAFACGLVSQVSAQEEPRAISSIAFGSCLSQNRSQEIWERVRAQNPDLVVLMGDNIYADNVSLPVRRLEYAKVSSNQFFKALRSSSEIVGTWDDHDYGYNDAGKEYIGKHDSQLAFLEFFQVPSDDPRRSRAGVYFSKFFEAQGQALQLIVLDTRYFRDRLIKDAEAQKHGKKPVMEI